MTRGTWIIKDGKKIAAVYGKDGARPLDPPKKAPKPKKAQEE